MTDKDLIDKLIKLNNEAAPSPWYGNANIPFNASIDKPRPSLSKHDSKCPHYWRVEDVALVLELRNNLDQLLALAKKGLDD